MIRFLMFACVIVVSYTVVVSLFLPSVRVRAAPLVPVGKKEGASKVLSSMRHEARRSMPVETPLQQRVSNVVDESDQPRHLKQSESPMVHYTIDHDHKRAESPTKHEDHSHFDAALARVLSMLPDEIHVREMLRHIDGTGKEKLRETGLRARAFREFFKAWEDLHIVSKDGQMSIRDDVIQTLRRRNPTQNLAQTIRSYEAYRSFLQRLSAVLFPWTAPYFADHMTLHAHFYQGGRGIVLTAGDNQAPYLLTLIPSFRQLGCTLPIEIMYLGDSDLSEDYREELEMFPGVITRDLSQMVNDEGWRLAGWAAKPFAILLSSFRELIFVDADALFFRNPEVLFSDPQYTETGALFFRDRLIMPESKKRFLQQILPKDKPLSKQVRQNRFWTGESGHMQESGVVVVDKWKHFVALLLVTRMNGPDRDGNEAEGRIGIYDMVYGDKETFWIGWELVGDQEYAFHDGGVGIMGTVTDRMVRSTKEEEAKMNLKKNMGLEMEDHEKPELDYDQGPSNFTICAPQLLHLGFDGKPLWFNGWILNDKFAAKRQKKAGMFEVYLAEPREQTEEDAWKLLENNVCCLTSEDEPSTFTEVERDTLNMITDIAKNVCAYGKKGKPGRVN